MTTDTSERGLEDLIVRAMTGHTDLLSPQHVAAETLSPAAMMLCWLESVPCSTNCLPIVVSPLAEP